MISIQPHLLPHLQKLGITALNPMQLSAYETIQNNAATVVLSPTGSGKTLGFLLPLIAGFQNIENKVQAMVIVPSRELAIQIEDVFKKLQLPHKVNVCYGGHPFSIERKNLSHPPALLIGTPGRISDHIRRNTVDLSTIKTLVLDEFDKSLELGFHNEMAFIIESLPNTIKKVLTSATPLDKLPAFTHIENPVRLNFLQNQKKQQLTTYHLQSPDNDKLLVLFNLLCYVGNEPTLVFCNHRDAVERISVLLAKEGIYHDVFHGGLEQEDRERALIKFRNGSMNILLTTDLASRGLDIPEIKHIIHYQLPLQEDAFIHRNGRTARMHAEGKSYILTTAEEYLPTYAPTEIELLNLPEEQSLPEVPAFTTVFVGAGKKNKVNKIDIVGTFCQVGGLQKEDIGVISVADFAAFVAVKRGKAMDLIKTMRHQKLKGKQVRIDFCR